MTYRDTLAQTIETLKQQRLQMILSGNPFVARSIERDIVRLIKELQYLDKPKKRWWEFWK